MNNLPKFEKHGFSEFLNLPFDIQVSTIGSALGYGAISAVVPIVLLSSIFSSTPFPELALSSNYLVQGFYILIPALLFLLTASITGAFLTAFSDHFLNRKHILFCYLASLLLAVFTLFSISKYLVLLSLGISYALSRFLWKIHILNKDMNAYAIAFASVFTGLFVLSSIFLVTSALTILPTLLIILSNGFFALAIVNTCTDWVVVPRAALLGRKKNIGRIMLPTAANVLTGIALNYAVHARARRFPFGWLNLDTSRNLVCNPPIHQYASSQTKPARSLPLAGHRPVPCYYYGIST